MTEKNFWNCSGDELLKEFKTDSRGLSTERAEEIRSEKGENVLQEGKRKSKLTDATETLARQMML